jgi:hypothetical protein
MLTYQSGGLESTERGAYFPRRPYYPLLAANGSDAILLGIAGFPDDPNWMSYSMPLPSRISLGWFKTGRRDYLYAHKRYGVPSSGTSAALAAPTTLLTVGRENNLGVRNPHQSFDPKTRVLTTTFELTESRGKIPAKIRVTSFLTEEHLLIEHYEVLQAPQSGFRLGFQLRPAFPTDMNEFCVYPKDVRHEVLPRGFRFSYVYESPEIPDGAAATWTDLADCTIENEGGEPVVDRTPLIPAGGAVTHYVAVVDADDAKDFHGEIDRLREKTLTKGYEAILKEHIEQNPSGELTARVHLPEKDLEYLYDYSHYVLDASFDRESGFLPMGILPTCWQNAMFWDMWFASMAWLGSNRPDKAARISRFYRNKLGEARQLAAKMGTPGARFAWTTNRDHFEIGAENVVQFHNNAVIALQSLQVYEFTGDEEFLRESIDLVEGALLFLTEKLVKVDGGVATLRACAGLDESTSDLKGTDTWTGATYLRALELYLKSCEKLGRKPFRDSLVEIADRIRQAVDRNVDGQAVLQSFEGGMSPHWGSLIFHLFPQHPSRFATLQALSHYDAELDSYNSHGVAGYRGRIFTWTEFWISRLLAADEKPEGWQRLRQCAKFSDGFGSFPERVFYHGELLKQPFMSSHASYVWAMNSLLVNRQGDRLAVFTNLPAEWENVSFENLTTPDGLQVSAKLKNRKIVKLEVKNLSQQEREVDLSHPGQTGIRFSLPPGGMYQRPL